jgi:hypothetical protein
LHSDLSVDSKIANGNSDPDGGKRHGKEKWQQSDDGQLVAIPSANEFQPMIISGRHHLGGDIDISGLRRIKQESDLTGTSSA